MDPNLNFWQSLALAAIQGLTEFLPVSSSGHLVLARRLFGWSDQGGLLFDTLLHAGSLTAILIYFWRDWLSILHAYFSKQEKLENPQSSIENPKSKIQSEAPRDKPRGIFAEFRRSQPAFALPSFGEVRPAIHPRGSLLRRSSSATEGREPRGILAKANKDGVFYRRLPWLIIAATIPAVIAGPLLKPALESDAVIRNAAMTGLSMIMTALLFLLAERRLAPAAGKQLDFLNALFIGCMQVVALLPGASRSGWTTGGGILCGQSRENAVRFAFLMAVPAIAGAIIFQSREIIQSPQAGFDPVLSLSGFAMSFAVSFAAIHFCLKYFRNHSLRPFTVYLIIIGVLSLFIKLQ